MIAGLGLSLVILARDFKKNLYINIFLLFYLKNINIKLTVYASLYEILQIR